MLRGRRFPKRKFIYSIATIFVCGTLLFFLARSVWDVYQKNNLARKERNALLTEIAALEERKEKLESELERLETPRGLEEELRTKFQVSKPGEETVVLIEPRGESASSTRNSFWEKIKNLFR